MKSEFKRPLHGTTRRLCTLFPGALGDFLCCLPALCGLTEQGEVHVYARSEYAAIAPAELTVRSLERPEIAKLFTTDGAAEEGVRRFFSAYDAVYSWTGSGHAQFARQLAQAARGPVRIFPFRTNDPCYHQTEYYFTCLHGRAFPAPIPRVVARDEAVLWCEDFRARHALDGGALLALAPGSGAREKNWPAAGFAEVARWWRQNYGPVAVILGPAEDERRLASELEGAGVLVRGLDLAQAAALLASAVLYLGNDSGLSHLAAATGVRTAVLFGPTNVNLWAPRGARVTVVSREEFCAPCAYETMKQCSHRRCLNDLAADRVIGVLERLPEVCTLTRLGSGISV